MFKNTKTKKAKQNIIFMIIKKILRNSGTQDDQQVFVLSCNGTIIQVYVLITGKCI